jgi:ABC-type dipeptide/oligopeptide/nickel transport system permease component
MTIIIRRLIFVLPALLSVAIITFLVGRLAPGDPFQQLYGYGMDDATINEMRHHYGFDQPLWQQLLTYLGNLLQGDLGISFVRANTQVTELIGESIGPTLLVGGLSMVLATILGVGLGLWSAFQHGRLIDKIITALVSFFGAMPGFVLSYFIIWLVAINLKWFPPGGWGKPENLVLPVLVAALSPAAFVTRVCRASILNVLRQDYLTVAHAKGLAPGTVLRVHILKNGFIPVVTVIGSLAARSFTGLLFVEKIFGIPGLASLTIDSVPARDYAVIQGCTMLMAAIFIFFNLLVDIVNVVLDPRLKPA